MCGENKPMADSVPLPDIEVVGAQLHQRKVIPYRQIRNSSENGRRPRARVLLFQRTFRFNSRKRGFLDLLAQAEQSRQIEDPEARQLRHA